jgi:hypothetical protein
VAEVPSGLDSPHPKKLKRNILSTKLHDVILQKTVVFVINYTMKTYGGMDAQLHAF